MKKNLFIIAAVCLAAIFTGCGSGSAAVSDETAEVSEESEEAENGEENVLKAAAEAEQIYNLLSKYDNVYYKTAYYDADGEEYLTEYEYADKDMYVSEEDSGDIYIATADRIMGLDADGNVSEYVVMDGSGYDYWTADKEDFMFTYNDEEEVLSQTEEDGNIIVSSRLDTDEGYEEYTYTIDSETMEMSHVSTVYYDTEGNVDVSSEQELGFNTDVYEIPVEIAAAMSLEETRTVTVISDPGTDEEKVQTQEIGKGVFAKIALAEDYTTMYDDEACTVPHELSGLDDDITIYVAKGK
ncbi:MAG: hypothetical protein LUC92_08735 [Clostridiales bacterium]|nr:hypothetical protein [Clostridiales bacterium]